MNVKFPALPSPKKDNVLGIAEEEEVRLLRILRDSDPTSQEYSQALIRFKELHTSIMDEKKLKENRIGRWFEALTTGGILIATLTAEQWTPLTSKWFTSIMHPFRARKGSDF